LKVESPTTATINRVEGNAIVVPAEGFLKGICFIKIPTTEIKSAKTVVVVGIYRADKLIEKVSIKFIGPVSK
jgi:hypothetical protein